MAVKRTMIIGATPDPSRYAFKAANMLRSKGHEIVNIGIKKGTVAGVEINPPDQPVQDVHTITLYIGPANQPQYYDYIVNCAPKRVIFNPGTENPELERLLRAEAIEPVQACTLVMLATGQY